MKMTKLTLPFTFLAIFVSYSLAITAPSGYSPILNRPPIPPTAVLDEKLFLDIYSGIIQNNSNQARLNNAILVRAKAALVLDMKKGEVIYQRNATSPFPIASITKLMTVVTFMDLEPDLKKHIEITRKDVYRANWTKLRYREQVSVKDLLYATLIASDNAAARALVRATGLSMENFVEKMNTTAISLGLSKSEFTEPTGLDARNISTAFDCVVLLWNALQNEVLAEILLAKEYRFGTNRRIHTIRSTNRLVREIAPQRNWECVGSKTGYIRRAGYCLVLRAHGDWGEEIYAVILGGPTSRTRFTDMRRLLDWSLKNINSDKQISG